METTAKKDRCLKDIFIAPPISVLDVKQKYWKDRKKQWLSLGIQSELGRNKNLLKLSDLLQKKQKATSVFDPVLTECMYRWFTKEGDNILDPFCGGSVRGIVASKLKRDYFGLDIREEQIEHNIQQADELEDPDHPPCFSLCDSNKMVLVDKYDFIFTCPPYYDLEKYSDDPQDLSNMGYGYFEQCLGNIIEKSVMSLNDNRFCAIVVGDVRGKDGNYMSLIPKVIEMFEDMNCHLYNDLILLQEPATAAMRAFNYMNSSRKIAKCHQNVLVFLKGDAKIATERLGIIEDKGYDPFD